MRECQKVASVFGMDTVTRDQAADRDQRIAAAVAGFTTTQVSKALKVIAENRIKTTEFANEFIVVGSQGDHYLCAPDACWCRGSHRRGEIARCYHQAAVRLLLASGEAA